MITHLLLSEIRNNGQSSLPMILKRPQLLSQLGLDKIPPSLAAASLILKEWIIFEAIHIRKPLSSPVVIVHLAKCLPLRNNRSLKLTNFSNSNWRMEAAQGVLSPSVPKQSLVVEKNKSTVDLQGHSALLTPPISI